MNLKEAHSKELTTSKYLSLSSKPLDLLNAMEYAYATTGNISSLKVGIVGSGYRQSLLKEMCEKLSIEFFVVPDCDLYSTAVYGAFKNRTPALVTIILKSILYVFSRPAWYTYFLFYKFQFSGDQMDILILDLWRNKVVPASGMNFKKLVVIDGGQSTSKFELIKAWEMGGIQMALGNALQGQSVSIPKIVRKLVAKKFNGKHAEFFSSYLVNGTEKNGIRKNRYLYSKNVVSESTVENSVLILGFPFFTDIERQVEIARTLAISYPNARIQYQLHPTDADAFQRDLGFRSKVERLMNDLGVMAVFGKFSFEVDLIVGGTIPSAIVTYQSSANAWIADVLGERVTLVEHFIAKDSYLAARRKFTEMTFHS